MVGGVAEQGVDTRLHLEILPQPDEATCGPTCLHAVYQYFGDSISLGQVVHEAPRLRSGGTLAVFLACHALRRGYRARIYTYNLSVFDPTWFTPKRPIDLRERLVAQRAAKKASKLHEATRGYLDFLDLGGELRFEDLTPGLVRRYLNRSIPILTGLSSTYLYRSAREYGPRDDEDDVRGEPAGHFVVLCGYGRETRQVLVADPLHPNPVSPSQVYPVGIDRVLCSILLGILTYDANLLVLHPGEAAEDRRER